MEVAGSLTKESVREMAKDHRPQVQIVSSFKVNEETAQGSSIPRVASSTDRGGIWKVFHQWEVTYDRRRYRLLIPNFDSGLSTPTLNQILCRRGETEE